MQVNAERLLASLKLSGLRMTASRKAVCQVLAESHDEHLTATDLHRRVEEITGTRVDPSTIYRTIDILSEAGFLHHVHFGHGPGVVHLSEESQHHHIVCEACGRTVDLDQEELESLAEVLDSHGYTSGSVHFAIIAHCQNCT